MRWRRSALAASLISAIAILPTTQSADGPQTSSKSVNDEIIDTLVNQVAAWNKGDLDAFMSTYWKSGDLTFFSGKEVMRGWDKTRERYRKRYQTDGKAMGKLSFSELKAQLLAPDFALVRGRWHLLRDKENFEGLFTLILKKTPNGWRIIHDHTSGS